MITRLIPNFDRKFIFTVIISVGYIIIYQVGYKGFKIRPVLLTVTNASDRSLYSRLACETSLHIKQSYQRNKPTLTESDIKMINIDNETKCKDASFLVYKCDSSAMCGGWADRQKGMITTFLLALLTNRTFVIQLTNPCDLNTILQPNIYRWDRCKHYLKKVPRLNITELNLIVKQDTLKDILSSDYDFETRWRSQVIVLLTNSVKFERIRLHKYAVSRLGWFLNMTNENSIQAVLNTLFKPRKRLIDDLQKLKDNHVKNKLLVCCHFRVGKNPSNPRDLEGKIKTSAKNVIFDFLKKYDSDNSLIYIASDSDDIRTEGKTRLRSFFNLNKSIVHIDRFRNRKKPSSEACEGFYNAVLEQYILSKCDTLVLTDSGYGAMAALMRGLFHNIYKYDRVMDEVLQLNVKELWDILIFGVTQKVELNCV